MAFYKFKARVPVRFMRLPSFPKNKRLQVGQGSSLLSVQNAPVPLWSALSARTMLELGRGKAQPRLGKEVDRGTARAFWNTAQGAPSQRCELGTLGAELTIWGRQDRPHSGGVSYLG